MIDLKKLDPKVNFTTKDAVHVHCVALLAASIVSTNGGWPAEKVLEKARVFETYLFLPLRPHMKPEGEW